MFGIEGRRWAEGRSRLCQRLSLGRRSSPVLYRSWNAPWREGESRMLNISVLDFETVACIVSWKLMQCELETNAMDRRWVTWMAPRRTPQVIMSASSAFHSVCIAFLYKSQPYHCKSSPYNQVGDTTEEVNREKKKQKKKSLSQKPLETFSSPISFQIKGGAEGEQGWSRTTLPFHIWFNIFFS